MNRDLIEGTLGDVTGKVEQTAGMATGDAARRGAGMVHEVGGESQNLYGQASEGFEDAVVAARELVDDVAGRTSDMYADIRQNLDGSLQPLWRRVERMPIAALFVVGAAGYVLGLLSSGGRR